MSKKGLTSMEENRVFFTAFAQNWCGKRSNAYAELLLSTDPHSPEKWRVNGPLMNFDQFAKTFKCKMGTPMNPKDRCIIW
jgi:putative endopeptidase